MRLGKLIVCRHGVLLATRVGVLVWWGTFGSYLDYFHMKVDLSSAPGGFVSDRPRCKATMRLRGVRGDITFKRCPNRAVVGAEFCRVHGGRAR